jgi:D-glycero-D-manno-heptose 1,7-bisphosphate phosphatase
MKKALFLDRDGIINIDNGYVFRPEEIVFVEGITDLLKSAVSKGYQLFVVTNQSGIARGYYEDKDVVKTHSFIKEHFANKDIEITEFQHCPHHPKFSGECDCRKPAPGMIKKLIIKYEIDPSQSVMIGDKPSDTQAGKNANVGKCILVSSQYMSEADESADHFISDIREAIDLI